MPTLIQIFDKIKLYKPILAERYSVNSIGVFGSFVRGENTEASDLDILVEFSKPISLFLFLDLEESLSRLLGAKVDLVSRKSMKTEIGKHILSEVKLV